jgi:hypothetical protein
MDFCEAIACLDEYRLSLVSMCAVLDSKVTQGEHREFNDRIIAAIDGHVNEAVTLSKAILDGMIDRRDQIWNFPSEWERVMIALKTLKLATDKAAQMRADYLGAMATAAKNEDINGHSRSKVMLTRFKLKHTGLSNEEREEYEQDETLRSAIEIMNKEVRTPTPGMIAIQKFLREREETEARERAERRERYQNT